MHRRTFVGLMAGAAVCAPGKFTTKTRAESKPPDAARMLEVTRVPGVAVAGMKDEQPYQLFASVERAGGPPVTHRTFFPAASLSKPVFAWAVQDLAKQGKIDWNRPLLDYVADFGLEGTARKITALHVLTHSTGLTNWRFQPNVPLASAFEPGTKWQYSNTNYVIAGLIVERITSLRLMEFLQQHVFGPLEMKSVFDTDAGPLPAGDPERYLRYGLGPVRPAPKEGKGWMFGAGELAMTASDLAKWDISMINQTVLKPASYFEMEKAELLKNGASTQYGLGVSVSLVNDRRLISHSGEVSGFTASNAVYPDERAAVVVLTNLDATRASINLANEIATMLFTPVESEGPLAEARAILAGLQKGKVDRSRFTSNANAYFSEQALKDLATSLAPLGDPTKFTEVSEGLRGGMTFHRYRAKFATQNLTVSTYAMPDGKLEQFIVAPEN